MDEDASSPEATVGEGCRPGIEPSPEAFPARPAVAAGARYQPLRPIEELIDDVLGRTG